MRRLAATLALLLAARCTRPRVTSQPPPRVAVSAPRVPRSEALAILTSLADEVGPRLSGSPNDARAVAWGLRTMTALGLSNVRAEPVTVPHWERGDERGEVLSPAAHPVVLTALGGSVATPPDGVEADVVEVPSLDALDALDPAQVRGRIVFVRVVMRRTVDGSGYGEAVGTRSRAAVRAARKGAVAVVIRSVGTGDERIAHTGALRYDDAVPRIPAAALSIPDADSLHRLIAGGATVRMRVVLGCRTLPDAASANVVGEVPPTDGDDGVVVLGAHLDSWDLGLGAIDDGAGVSIVLETARTVLRDVPRRRRALRVVLFANEENGLAGARAYAAAHADELPRHTVAIEADTGDGRVRTLGYAGDAAGRARFDAILARVAPFGVALNPEPAHGGADVSPLISAGVPRLSLGQDMSRYFDHHHTVSDTPAIVRRRDLDQAVAVYVATASELVTMQGDFGRAPVPPEER